MKTTLSTLAILLFALCLSVPTANAQDTSPVAVIEAFIAAENARNVDAALAYLTDSAVITEHPTRIHAGRDAVRAYLQRRVDGFVTVEILEPPRVVDGKLKWTEKVSESGLVTTQRVQAQVQDNEISALNVLEVLLASGRDVPWIAPPGADVTINAYLAALNARNVDAALALFADDAVINENPLDNPDLIHTGKDAIRAYLQRLVDSFIEIKILQAPHLVDDKVQWTEENAESALLTRRQVEGVVRDGNIKSITVLDIPFATARTFPWTGGSGWYDTYLLLAVGGVVLLALGGLVVYAASRPRRPR